MNEQLARSLFMDYLYDEIDADDRQRLEKFLSDRPDLQAELEKLNQTRTLLQQMPAPESGQPIVMVEPRERTFADWLHEAKSLLPRTAIGRVGFAMAAGFILLLFVGSVARMHISSGENGLSISMGHTSVVNEGITPEQVEGLIEMIREENTIMMANYAEALNEQNSNQIRQVVEYFEQQRLNDLQSIDHSFTQIEENTTEQWLATNRFLGNLLQNVNMEQPNE